MVRAPFELAPLPYQIVAHVQNTLVQPNWGKSPLPPQLEVAFCFRKLETHAIGAAMNPRSLR